MRQNKTTPDRVEAAEKRKRAVELRKLHYSYEEIAEELCLSRTTVRDYVAKEMELLRKETAEQVQEMRDMELKRLDELLKSWFPLAKAGDEKAAGIVLKAQERRAKLVGLDAPVKQELTGKDGGAIKTVSTTADLSGLTDAQLEQLQAILNVVQPPAPDLPPAD